MIKLAMESAIPNFNTKNRIDLYIGEYHASHQPQVIHTILGSCIAVCLFDPMHRIGGMNHILLPGDANLYKYDDSARYGINAMELLINLMMGLGCSRNHLVAKVFGGAHIISAISKENGMGDKNIAFVLSFLKNENIKIINKDVGGNDSRKIFFHTDTGDVYLRRTPPLIAWDVLEKEMFFSNRLKNADLKPGEIELFDN